MNGELAFQFVGLPWWLVLPSAALLAWLIGRLARRELATQPRPVARGLVWLRRAVVVLVLIFLLEPTLTRTRSESELPTVAVVVDRSGSMALDDRQMAASARLDEAVALGLIDPDLRPSAPRRVAQVLADLIADGPTLSKAVAAVGEAQAGGGVLPAVDDARQRAEYHAEALADVAPAAAGLAAVGDGLAALRVAVVRAGAVLTPSPASEIAPDVRPEAVAAQLGKALEMARTLLAGAEDAQRAADTALVAGAEAGSPVAAGLATLASRSREQRAFDLVRRSVLPRLADRARVEFYALGNGAADSGGLSVLAGAEAPGAAPAGTTDFAAPLAWLSRTWSSRHVGGVLLLSDGRQTAGADPVPVARALAARGGRVSALLVGDPEPPRDAVVAEVSAPAEVFRGEVAHLDARWRVTGYPERSWDLVLTRDGRELERRSVRGATAWQVARFEVPANELAGDEPSLRAFQVRIEASPETAGDHSLRAGVGLLREVWTGVSGLRLDDFFTNPARRAPDTSGIIPDGIITDDRENYVSRLRGWVVPPASGEYTFWVEGDDQGELWIAPSGEPHDRVRVATVPEWTQPLEWDKYAAQRSAPIPLRAGAPCYVEVLHKQGHGGGHAALGWQMPDNTIERPIPGTRLTPWSEQTSAPARDDEASLANNSAEATVTVAQDPLRVLVLDEQPRWELRYLVALFERDRRVEVVRRYRSVRLPRKEFDLLPTDSAALDAFDVVVLGDLPPATLSNEDQQHLAHFVGRRGGLLIAIAGPRGMPWGYSLGGIADLLPVRVAGGMSSERKPVAIALTAAGQAHPITSVLDDLALNQKLWQALPRLEWAATAVVAKPGSEVLLATTDPTPAPIVALSRYGSGRVLWAGSDELWRWRDRLGDRVHQTFWLQAVRWGLGARLRGKDRRLQAALDRALLEPGEAAELRARAVDDAGRPAGVPRVTLERLDEAGQPVAGTRQQPAFSAVADTDLASVRLAGLDEGRWRVTVTSDDPRLAGLSEVRELVVRQRSGDEGIELGTDAPGLARLAAAGGGTSGGFADAESVLDDFIAGLEPKMSERRTTTSLWQNHGALAAVLALLVVEWMWRKRRGLS